jgi:Ni/Fe-hydrogenase subunit HybB-like protein
MRDNFTLEVQTLEEKRLATPPIKWATTCCILLTLIGVTAGVYGTMVGHNFVYGIFRDMPWGIIIATFAYMANLATGLCLVAVIGHAYGLTTLSPLGMRAVYLAIVSTIAAFMLFFFGVENPWRMLLLNAMSPNLTSNIWWLTTLYGIMSGCLFLRVSCQVSNRHGWAIGIGIIAAVTGVGANNNLGGLFTLAADPPIWYGFQLIVFFLASAVMAGVAAIIVFSYLAFTLRKQRIIGDTLKALQTAGTILTLMLAILLVILVSRFYAMFFGDAPDPGKIAALALLKGPLAFNFWVVEIVVGIVGPLIILVVTKLKNVRAMTLAGGLALVGGFFQRIDLVISAQIVPKYFGWNNLPVYLHYFPTLPEILVVLGGVALLGAGFLLGERFIGRIFRY